MRCSIAWVETVFVHLSNFLVLPFPANNTLTGTIPSVIESLRSLVWLDIGALLYCMGGNCFRTLI